MLCTPLVEAKMAVQAFMLFPSLDPRLSAVYIGPKIGHYRVLYYEVLNATVIKEALYENWHFARFPCTSLRSCTPCLYPD